MLMVSIVLVTTTYYLSNWEQVNIPKLKIQGPRRKKDKRTEQ